MGHRQKKEKVTLIQAFKSNFYMMKIAFEACPGRVIGAFLSRLCEQVHRILLSIIFWEVVLGFIEEDAPFERIVIFLIILIAALFILNFGRGYIENVTAPVGNQMMYEKLHTRMFEKATDVGLECYENPEFYNKYMKVVTQIKGKVFAVFPFLSNYFIGKKINKVNYKLYQKNIFEERKKEYVKRSIYQQDLAKELRLSNGFFLLMYYFKDAVEVVVKNTKQYGIKAGLLSCLSSSMYQIFVAAGSIFMLLCGCFILRIYRSANILS